MTLSNKKTPLDDFNLITNEDDYLAMVRQQPPPQQQHADSVRFVLQEIDVHAPNDAIVAKKEPLPTPGKHTLSTPATSKLKEIAIRSPKVSTMKKIAKEPKTANSYKIPHKNKNIPDMNNSYALVNPREEVFATAETIATSNMKESQILRPRPAKRKLLSSQELNEWPKTSSHQPYSTPIKSFAEPLELAESSNVCDNKRVSEFQTTKESVLNKSEGKFDGRIRPDHWDFSDTDFVDGFGLDDSFADPDFKLPIKMKSKNFVLTDRQVPPVVKAKRVKKPKKVVAHEDVDPDEVIFQKENLKQYAIEYFSKRERKMKRQLEKTAKATRELTEMYNQLLND